MSSCENTCLFWLFALASKFVIGMRNRRVFPFYFLSLRICVQGFFTPVDSRATSNAIKTWSKSHWNWQVAIHGLYGAFSWTFSSFGPRRMLSCFHIHMKSFAYFEVLLGSWARRASVSGSDMPAEVAHLQPSSYNSVYQGLNWSRKGSMRGLMADLK